MKKSLLCVLCVLLCALCLLTACVKSPTSVFDKSCREAPAAYNAMTELQTVKGIVDKHNEDFIVLINAPGASSPVYEDVRGVYGFEEGRVIWEAASRVFNTDVNLLGYGLFAVRTPAASEKDVDKWTIYNAHGKTVQEFAGSIYAEDDLLYAGHAVWQMKDGRLKKTDISWDPGKNLYPRTGDYRFNDRYNTQTDSTDGCDVYDLGGNLLSAYRFPSYASETRFVGMLNNGNVLIQYTEQVGTAAEEMPEKEYDYKDGDGNLYRIVTFLMMPENGKLRSLSLGELVCRVGTREDSDGYYGRGAENIAELIPIDDNKRIDTTGAIHHFVVMDNNGAVSEIKKLHPAQLFLPMPVGKDMWAVRCIDYSFVLCTGSGKSVATVKNFGYDFYVTSGGIYDLSGELKVDLTALGLTVDAFTPMYVIMHDADGNVRLYGGGQMTELSFKSEEARFGANDSLVIATPMGTDGTAASTMIWNHTGSKLGTVSGSISIAETPAGTFLTASDTTKSETVIYRLVE